LGFAIASAEAQHEAKVGWTSAKFEMTKMQVVIAIKPVILQHIYNGVCVFQNKCDLCEALENACGTCSTCCVHLCGLDPICFTVMGAVDDY